MTVGDPHAKRSGTNSVRSLFVVDDDLAICEFIKIIAEDCGFAVTFATRVREFRECFAVGAPDVVVSDIAMPAEDGVDLLEFLRTQDYRNPVILISQFEGYLRSAATFARTIGIRQVQALSKPLTVEMVRAALLRAARD